MIKNVSHFYDKISYQIKFDEELIKIAEKYKVESLNSGTLFNLEDKKDKEEVNVKVLISSHELVVGEKTTYLKGKLSIGGTNQIDFKAWNNDGFAEKLNVMFETNKYVGIEGNINIYQGKKSIIIKDVVPLDIDNSDVLSLLPRTTLDRNELISELLFYISELDDRFSNICLQYLEKYGKNFFDSPAALGHHHNYIGGLLKHTVGLMRIAYCIKSYDDSLRAVLYLKNVITNEIMRDVWSDYKNEDKEGMKKDYDFTWNGSIDHFVTCARTLALMLKRKDEIDWNIVFTAILFHDSGKIMEYSFLGEDTQKFKLLYPKIQITDFVRGSISMDPNKGQGHIPLGTMILMDIINISYETFTDVEIAKLNNSILAHHGKAEWGSPSRFEYAEAVIVHLSDFCDSKWEKDDPIK